LIRDRRRPITPVAGFSPVDKGAAKGGSFISYVEFLSSQNYVPPDGKLWVDHIRTKSNEANHEIVLMTPEDAKDLITFVEMLLKFIYEFPGKVKKPTAATATTLATTVSTRP